MFDRFAMTVRIRSPRFWCWSLVLELAALASVGIAGLLLILY